MPAVGKSILLDYVSLKPLLNAYKLYDLWQGVDLTFRYFLHIYNIIIAHILLVC